MFYLVIAMFKLTCPICDAEVILDEKSKLNDRITCTNCYAQLAFKKVRNKLELRCSLCPNDHKECLDDCERRISHLKQHDLME